jgi:hypothetical protein
MSFILKALKKLENEKAASRPAPVEIDSAILAPDRSSFSSPRRRVGWTIIPLALLTGTCIIYFVAYKTPPPVTEGRKMVPQAAPTAQTPPPGQVIEPPVERPAQVNAGSNTPVAHQQAPFRRKGERNRPESAHMQSDYTPPSEPLHQASFAAAPPALTVSGIALQDDPSESMAVINGALVKTGMTVGGSLVERIFLDRVRFKGSGGPFEVYLSK